MAESRERGHYHNNAPPPDQSNFLHVRSEVRHKERRNLPLPVTTHVKINNKGAIHRKDRQDSFTSHKQQNSFKPLKEQSLRCRAKYIWLGIIFGTICTISLTVYGLIQLRHHAHISGWAMVGSGVIVLGAVIILVVLHYRFQFEEYRKKIERASLNSKENFFHKSLCDFPPDPVLRRGIVKLVPHGQEDCVECRKMREKEMSSNTFKDFANTLKDSHPPLKVNENTNTKQHSSAYLKITQKDNMCYKKSPSPRRFNDLKKNQKKRSGTVSASGYEEHSVEKDGVSLHIRERYRNSQVKKKQSNKNSTPTPTQKQQSNRNNNSKRNPEPEKANFYQTKTVCSLSRHRTQPNFGNLYLPRINERSWEHIKKPSTASDSLAFKRLTSINYPTVPRKREAQELPSIQQ